MRRRPLKNAFTYRSYTWFVDVDHLPRLPAGSAARRLPAGDHLGDPGATIRSNVERFLRTQGMEPDGGAIHMLTSARVFGLRLQPADPVLVLPDPGDLECVIAEVHNTYGERHCYLLGRTPRAGLGT